MNRLVWAIILSLMTSPALAGPKEELIVADKAFSALSAAQGSNAAFLAVLADDGRIFGTGNEKPIYGKAEAIKRFADPKAGNGDPRRNVLSWTPDFAETSKDGTLGYTDGHWLFVGRDAKGAEFKLTGRYVTVWRKEGAVWNVISDMGTNDPVKK